MTTNDTNMEDLLAPFVGITRQCYALNEAILKPSFDGFTRLDPTLNKATYLIHAADEAIARYPQGAFPLEVARLSVKESLRLLRRCRKRYGRVKTKVMEQAYHFHFRLWFYRGEPLQPREAYLKKLFESEARLIDAICDHNAHITEPSAAKAEQDALSAKLDKNTERILKAIRGEGEKPFDRRSPQERRLIDLAAIHYARRRYLDGLDVPKSDCIRHVWKKHGDMNVFRDYASFANAVRYDLDRYYNLDVLIARAKTERVPPHHSHV